MNIGLVVMPHTDANLRLAAQISSKALTAMMRTKDTRCSADCWPSDICAG